MGLHGFFILFLFIYLFIFPAEPCLGNYDYCNCNYDMHLLGPQCSAADTAERWRLAQWLVCLKNTWPNGPMRGYRGPVVLPYRPALTYFIHKNRGLWQFWTAVSFWVFFFLHGPSAAAPVALSMLTPLWITLKSVMVNKFPGRTTCCNLFSCPACIVLVEIQDQCHISREQETTALYLDSGETTEIASSRVSLSSCEVM